MTLRLSEEQDATLQRLADAQHISKHEAVIRAIEDHASRVEVATDVASWTEHALVRYHDLLERLSQ
jgi:predicted transcriptional regulator